MAKKKGVCRNIDGGCSLAEGKVVQEVESTSYVCEECGAELYEIKESGKKQRGGPKSKWGLIAAIAAIVLAAGAATFFLLRDKAPETTPVETVALDKEAVELPPSEPSENPEPPVNPEPKKPAAGYSLGWGTYTGPMQGGKPHGLGGEVKVTKAYTLDLKKGNGEVRSLDRGDKIVDCKFKDGKLVSGYIHYADGRQERINIGA